MVNNTDKQNEARALEREVAWNMLLNTTISKHRAGGQSFIVKVTFD
jgi:hypothetical protein